MNEITLTYTGYVMPAIQTTDGLYGYDFGGYFGTAGASLAGDPFTIVWTGYDCNCTYLTAGFNPVIDATLSINGHTYDFGAGDGPGDDFLNLLHQVQDGTSVYLSTNLNVPNQGVYGQNGSFAIGLTKANLFVTPAPVIGSGLPSILLFAAVLVAAIYRSRSKLTRCTRPHTPCCGSCCW